MKSMLWTHTDAASVGRQVSRWGGGSPIARQSNPQRWRAAMQLHVWLGIPAGRETTGEQGAACAAQPRIEYQGKCPTVSHLVLRWPSEGRHPEIRHELSQCVRIILSFGLSLEEPPAWWDLLRISCQADELKIENVSTSCHLESDHYKGFKEIMSSTLRGENY